jgi:hypothetical protein
MEHLIWFGVVLALLLSVMPTTPSPAQYQVQPPAKEYDSLLQNLRSRLCLQPEYESRIMVSRSCNSRATGTTSIRDGIFRHCSPTGMDGLGRI